MEETSRALADSVGAILGTSAVDRTKPRYHFFDEGEQYRLKVQRFSKVPCEVTVQRISFEAEQDRYRRAAAMGLSHVSTTRKQRDPDRPRDDESIERSQRRAKTAVRLRVTELGPGALLTFTTRKIYSLDALASIWARFVRMASKIEPTLAYVCVPEPHPTRPEHLHLHAATRGRISRDTLRRLWHIALEGYEGRRVTKTLRGAQSPGNIDQQVIKGRDVIKRIRKIGRYISKYITKDLLERFNRRRYWPSKGINLAAAQVFWLDSLSQTEALREACMMLGHWDEVAPAFKVFRPSDRVAWYAVDLDAIPPPPF
jgi:hypothetical protein